IKIYILSNLYKLEISNLTQYRYPNLVHVQARYDIWDRFRFSIASSSGFGYRYWMHPEGQCEVHHQIPYPELHPSMSFADSINHSRRGASTGVIVGTANSN
uniref:Uncharacterized protein n=1 Tax=Oryzias melastigma TaxID=30732 RepID=A0A3B3CHL6_ORYME